MNDIIIYQNNSKEIIADVEGITLLSGYTTTLTVKKNVWCTGNTIQVTGTTDLQANTVQFSLTPEITATLEGLYTYQIDIENDTDKYTINQANLLVIKGINTDIIT